MNPSFLADFCITDFIADLETYQKYIRQYQLSGLQKRLAKSEEIILVHQMGKVGSSSIVKTLKASPYNAPVTHTHFLNKNRLKMQIKTNIDRRNGIIKRHLIESLLLLNSIKTGEKKIRIVTLIRDPVSKNVSNFFESIADKYASNFYLNRDSQAIEVDRLIAEFLARDDRQAPLNWLERELNLVFGIDIYQEKFNFEDKYQIYERDKVRILLLRLENISELYCSLAFNDFLGLKSFSLNSRNISSKKEYSKLYKKFKQEIFLPKTYLNEMYTSKMVRHFYTEKEIDFFKSKWSV